jgi:O-antigen ligase
MSTTYDPEPPSTTARGKVREGSGRSHLPGVRGHLPRVALTIVGLTAFVLGASGFDTTHVFHQFSMLKWAFLVAAPLLVMVLLTVERPSAWAIGLVAITIPVEPYVATVHGQPISVLFVTLVVATVVVEVEGGGRRRSPSRSPALGRVLPYGIVLLLVPVVLGVQPLHELLYLLAFLDIAWLCAKVGGLYPEGRLLIVLFFVGSASLQALMALAQYVSGNAFNLYGGAGSATYSAQRYFFNYGTTTRTTGTFFDPNSLGNVLAMALPLALLLVLRTELPGRLRLGAAVASVVLVGGLAVSLSRASCLAAAAGIVAVAVFSRGDQRRRGAVLVGVLIVGAVSAASVLYGPAITSRFTSILHPTASNQRSAAEDKGRQADWAEALAVFEAHPVAGVGFGNLVARIETTVPGSGPSSEAQNTYLQYMAEGGVFGAGVLLLLIGGVCADLHRTRKVDWMHPGLVGASLGVAVTWVTDFTVRYYSVAGCLAILVGLIASAAKPDGPSSDERVPAGRGISTGR